MFCPKIIGTAADSGIMPVAAAACNIPIEAEELCKIAVMPQSLADVAALLLATGTMKENHPETLLITMSMGRTGCVSRLCGGLFGSVMSFGSMGKASAPGQVSAKELSDVLWAIERAVE